MNILFCIILCLIGIGIGDFLAIQAIIVPKSLNMKKTFYNKNPMVTINKWKEFCDNDKLIFENQLDKKCFKIYISKLSSYVDENNELELYKYISYISNYFLPDVE